MKTIAPEAQIIDITHGIPAQAVLEGALVLANTIGVHAGGRPPRGRRPGRRRTAPAARAARRGRTALRRARQRAPAPGGEPSGNRGRARARQPGVRARRRSRARSTGAISSARRPRTSRTASRSTSSARRSHPGGARQSRRSRAGARRTGCSSRRSSTSTASGTSRSTSRVRTSSRWESPRGRSSSSSIAGERYYAVMARTFADARPGDVILYEDSYGNMSVAISRGDAGRMLHASPGQRIRIARARLSARLRKSADAWPPTVGLPRAAQRAGAEVPHRPAARSPARRWEGRRATSAAGATSPAAR